MNARRWWRLACVSRNPLVRTGDRVESAVLVFVLVLVLGALPFAFALGSNTYAHQRESAEAAAADRHPATAVLLADAPAPLMSPQGVPTDASAAVEATWRLPDGTVRTGPVTADRGSLKGAKVQIWLNGNGDAVAKPPDPNAVLLTAVTAAVLSWLAFATVAGGAFFLVRLAEDRRRYARWEREWARLPSGHSHS
ncbi:Rv1733c family protein [Amycolatopsis alkalitolerans]|uniref:Transmembrane protein n=1 Tax=Amycolatopsis alkalitolerans TaxID=2547244 RepID=A0A5C4M1L5_9PSEU|nr:hypothetical protein [Amycolatopsis alkalitolerans]TNC24814.1 hypothetical protein FG385_16330 [Amycolatopsis alkalitolerans]